MNRPYWLPSLVLLTVMGVHSSSWAKSPSIPSLLAELQSCHDMERAFCKQISGRLSEFGPNAVKPILQALPTLPHTAQLIGVMAITGIDGPKATRGLATITMDGTPVLRRLVIPALAKRSGRVVVSTLLRCLQDTDPFIRSLTAEVIVTATPKNQRSRVATALIRGTKDRVPSVRIACLESLGYLGYKSAVPTLLNRLIHGPPPEQLAAIKAFHFLPDKRAIEPCLLLMQWANPTLSATIGKTLERITGQKLGADYTQWKVWWEKKQKR